MLLCVMILLFISGYKINERKYDSSTAYMRVDAHSVLERNCKIDAQENMLRYLYSANCGHDGSACLLVYQTIVDNYSKNGILPEPYSEIACHYLRKGAEYGDNECIDRCKILDIGYGQE